MIGLNDYLHPKDRQLFGQLLEQKAVTRLFDWCRKNCLDEAYQYAYQASCLRITEKTLPSVYRIIEKACREFGVKIPKCYLSHNYDRKAELAGIFEPILIFSEEYIDRAGSERLYGTVAGQAAGIAAGHYRGLGLEWIFEVCADLLPVPQAGLTAVKALLNDWKRCRWFTCDRAFFLATKNYSLTLESLFDLNVPEEILSRFRLGTNRDGYQRQLLRYKEASAPAEIAGMIQSLQTDTAWIPERYTELQAFCSSRLEGG